MDNVKKKKKTINDLYLKQSSSFVVFTLMGIHLLFHIESGACDRRNHPLYKINGAYLIVIQPTNKTLHGQDFYSKLCSTSWSVTHYNNLGVSIPSLYVGCFFKIYPSISSGYIFLNTSISLHGKSDITLCGYLLYEIYL